MSFFRNIDPKAPHIQQLQLKLRRELAKRNYSAQEDPVMAEYIVVMLANQKTPDQITAEMNDLIGPEYDAAFTDWIYKATQTCIDHYAAVVSAQASGSADASASTSSTANGNCSARMRTRQRRSRSPQRSGSASRAREKRRSRSPTQFAAHRTDDQRRSRSRSPQARGPQRTSRNYETRETWRRDYSSNEAWTNSISLRRDDEPPFDGEAFWRSKAEERQRFPPPPAVNRTRGPRQTRLFDDAYDQAFEEWRFDERYKWKCGQGVVSKSGRGRGAAAIVSRVRRPQHLWSCWCS